MLMSRGASGQFVSGQLARLPAVGHMVVSGGAAHETVIDKADNDDSTISVDAANAGARRGEYAPAPVTRRIDTATAAAAANLSGESAAAAAQLAPLATLSAIGLWISISCVMIFFNKYLYETSFRYPLTLTAIHMGFASAATFALRRAGWLDAPHIMSTETWFRAVVPVAALLAVSLACSNMASAVLPVTFIQLLKSQTPAVTLAAGVAAGVETFTWRRATVMAWIESGMLLASLGSIQWHTLGVAFQLVAVAADGLRVILLQALLEQHLPKADPLVAVSMVAPPSFAVLLPLAVIMEPGALGVVMAPATAALVIVNACLAFVLNLAVVLLVSRTSALTLTLVGIGKDIVIAVLSLLLVATPVTLPQVAGYGVVMVGLNAYAVHRSDEGEALPTRELIHRAVSNKQARLIYIGISILTIVAAAMRPDGAPLPPASSLLQVKVEGGAVDDSAVGAGSIDSPPPSASLPPPPVQPLQVVMCECLDAGDDNACNAPLPPTAELRPYRTPGVGPDRCTQPNYGDPYSRRVPRRTNWPYLTLETYREIADHVWEHEYGCDTKPELVKCGDIVWMHHAHPIFTDGIAEQAPHPFILVTAGSDYPVPYTDPGHTRQYLLSHHPKLWRWYGNNAWERVPFTNYLPLGVEGPGWEPGNPEVMAAHWTTDPEVIRETMRAKLVQYISGNWSQDFRTLFAFTTSTNGAERQRAEGGATGLGLQRRSMSPAEYVADLHKYMFVLAPMGNGFDSHRQWEALNAGTIPVMRLEQQHHMACLPAVYVAEWHYLSWELLRGAAEEALANIDTYDFRRVFSDYHIARLRREQARARAWCAEQDGTSAAPA